MPLKMWPFYFKNTYGIQTVVLPHLRKSAIKLLSFIYLFLTFQNILANACLKKGAKKRAFPKELATPNLRQQQPQIIKACEKEDCMNEYNITKILKGYEYPNTKHITLDVVKTSKLLIKYFNFYL